jgi:ubiquinone/menaquinone biosynthesis C-methylase UbiE
MKKEMLYRELAEYYDLLYAHKDYAREVVKLKKLIVKYKRSQGRELLDVACGTGRHLAHLRRDFQCTGVDINQHILDVARRNVKDVVFLNADMTTLNLGKTFDVITCLFSSIGYVRTEANLRNTIQNLTKHLKTGGIALIEPWFTRAAYHVGSPHITTHDGEHVKIARVAVSQAKGNLSIIDMHYLIAEQDKPVKHFLDRHELGLFETDEVLCIMKETGLKAKFRKNGLLRDRGIFVGVKPR